MYGLLKGYASRKPTDADDNEVDEEENKSSNKSEDLGQPPQQSLQLRKDSSDSASYGRFLSWGLDGVSYLGSQLKSRVDRSLTWWTSPESEVEETHNKMASTKRSGQRQPEGTLSYTVTGSDTLNKIALVFDTTPSELTRMNKLTSRMLYPGQLLFVPDKSKAIKAPTAHQKNVHTDDHKHKAQAHVHGHHGHSSHHGHQSHHGNQSHHGHHGHQETIKLTKTVSLTSDDEEEISESFLKIKAKHITDGQGVVGGVILITPHSVIFNPNVSDPLVMDRGRDKYCIKTPMNAITSAALYKDIAAMAIHDPLKAGRFYLDEATKESVSRQNSVDVEHSKSSDSLHGEINTSKQGNIKQENERNAANKLKELQSPSIINKEGASMDEHGQLVAIANDILQGIISDVVANVCNEQIPKNLECNKTDQTSNGNDHNTISLSPLSEDSGICSPQKKDTFSKGADSSRQNKDQGKTNGGDNDRGSAVHTNKGQSDSCDHDTSHDNVVEDKPSTDEKRQSSFFENFSGDVKYWLGVSYRNEDDHAFEEEIIPQPATTYEDNLVYLCLRISKQHWCMCLAGVGEHCHKEADNVMNRDKKRREHWFAIPASRIEHVYSFIKQRCPNIKRTLSVSEDDGDDELLDDDDDDEEAVLYVDAFYSLTPPKPQITTTTETKHDHMTLEINRPSSCNTKESVITPDLSDDVMFMPEMSTESQILTPTQIKKLNKNLPSRAVGHGWTLVYCTLTHGFSLKTLYRNMEEYDTPMLIAVQDDQHQVFGVVTSCPLTISEGFYGNGQCFLFKFEGENIKTYSWRGDNEFFVKGSVDCIAFGGGGGHFGLWLDEDFYHGSSHYSETYHNEPLSTNEDFLCSALEAWTFM